MEHLTLLLQKLDNEQLVGVLLFACGVFFVFLGILGKLHTGKIKLETGNKGRITAFVFGALLCVPAALVAMRPASPIPPTIKGAFANWQGVDVSYTEDNFKSYSPLSRGEPLLIQSDYLFLGATTTSGSPKHGRFWLVRGDGHLSAPVRFIEGEKSHFSVRETCYTFQAESIFSDWANTRIAKCSKNGS